MTNKKMNHQLDQLGAMFCQLGNAAAQLVGDRNRMVGENAHRHGSVPKAGLAESAAPVYRVVREIETV
ncbi:hypothetical protein [Parapedobacter sp. 10938]|uniref:hypothetical protein n=1 Tax=Parapedobacter flavus TaxID=3110225 RepID=UPI002DBD89BA|nr:hypothetical protein [Parapedobacter sp. 10938]MEC3881193.1 hypothetical protein [Parapedobacter sp. 10938]